MRTGFMLLTVALAGPLVCCGADEDPVAVQSGKQTVSALTGAQTAFCKCAADSTSDLCQNEPDECKEQAKCVKEKDYIPLKGEACVIAAIQLDVTGAVEGMACLEGAARAFETCMKAASGGCQVDDFDACEDTKEDSDKACFDKMPTNIKTAYKSCFEW
jgi:hypothetical protein